MRDPMINNFFIDMLLIILRNQGEEAFFKRAFSSKECGLLNEKEFELLMEKALTIT